MKILLSDISIIYESSQAQRNWSRYVLRHEPTGIEVDAAWINIDEAINQLISKLEEKK